MKLENPKVNFTAKVYALTYDAKGNPIYIIDIFDDKGWYGYLEVDANKGPSGNDNDGYSFLGGAMRDEIQDNSTSQPTQQTSKINTSNATEIMNKELSTNHSIQNAVYEFKEMTINNEAYYNITISQLNGNNEKTVIGYAQMNAITGEITSINILKTETNSTNTTTTTTTSNNNVETASSNQAESTSQDSSSNNAGE